MEKQASHMVYSQPVNLVYKLEPVLYLPCTVDYYYDTGG